MHANIYGSDRARIYQGLLGWPEMSAFRTYFNKNLLLNFKITVDDINRDKHKYWEETPTQRGKTRRKKPTVHSKTEKHFYLFQYQRDTKTYTSTWKFFT